MDKTKESGIQGRRTRRSRIDAPSKQADEPDRGFDRLRYTGMLEEVARLLDAADRLPRIRTGKIAELRKRLDAGRYRVDSRVLAREILELEVDPDF